MALNDSPHSHTSQSPAFWSVIVFATGLIARLFLLLFYQPVSYSDTSSYRRLAQAVLGGFTQYDGTRTPGYPVFLALAGNDQKVWIAQLFLGLITTLLLFYIGWQLSGKAWFGGLIGLAHTLNLGQLFFESNLLTESLTAFLIVLSMAGMLLWLFSAKSRRVWLALGIGIASTLTLLVRPLFIYLPFYLFIVMGLSYKAVSRVVKTSDDEIAPQPRAHFSWNMPWQSTVALLLPVLILLGGWVGFIHTKYGDWALTTMTGYHLIQHTGNFFEYAPDEYAALRDTYIRYRDEQVAKTGTQANAIWEAIPEMSAVSGYNFYDLSRVLAKISIQLIIKHPFLFLKSAANGWWMFWRTSVYWSPGALRLPGLSGIIHLVIQAERAVLFFINLVFIFASIYFFIRESLAAIQHQPGRGLLRFSNPAQRVYFWMILGTIWVASILQTLLDHGDNPRFLVPLQSLVVLWVAFFLSLLLQQKKPIQKPVKQVE